MGPGLQSSTPTLQCFPHTPGIWTRLSGHQGAGWQSHTGRLGEGCMTETPPHFGKWAGQEWVVSDITTAPQYSELGGAGNRCPHFADKETEAHRGQATLFRAHGY